MATPIIIPERTGRGLLLVAAAAITWSTGGLIVRLLDDHDPWRTIFWRSLFAALFLIGYVAASEKRATINVFRSIGRPGLLLGLYFAIASVTFIIALGLTSVANTLVIISTAPLFAALLSRRLLGDVIRPRTWVAILASVAGVALMVGDSLGESSLLGNLVALVIPLLFALGTVVIRRQRHMRMTPALAVSPVIALLVATPLVPTFGISGHDLALLAFFGAGQLGLGMVLFSIGARMAPPAKAALVSLLETVVGPFWVWLVVGEMPGVGALLGGVIVLGAMALHTAFDLRRPLPPPVA